MLGPPTPSAFSKAKCQPPGSVAVGFSSLHPNAKVLHMKGAHEPHAKGKVFACISRIGRGLAATSVLNQQRTRVATVSIHHGNSLPASQSTAGACFNAPLRRNTAVDLQAQSLVPPRLGGSGAKALAICAEATGAGSSKKRPNIGRATCFAGWLRHP